MSVEAEQRAQVVQEARSWLLTPYHHHARIKGVGVDCAQLLAAVFEEVGLVPAIDTGFYPHDWHLHRGEEMFSAWLQKYAKPGNGTPQPGDVCLWRYGRTMSHGSICAGDGLFIHAYLGLGVILSGSHEEPLIGRDMQHWSFW
jgi:cell wall-associated NlpC family hydrolase